MRLSRRAQTMLELVLAIIIIGAAVASLVGALHRQLRESESSRELFIAMQLARDEVEYLRAVGYVNINAELNANGFEADTTSGSGGFAGGVALNPILVGPNPGPPAPPGDYWPLTPPFSPARFGSANTATAYDNLGSSEALNITRFQRRVEFLWDLVPDALTLPPFPAPYFRRVCFDPASGIGLPSYSIRVRVTITTNGGSMVTGTPSTAHQIVTYIGQKNVGF